MNCLLKFQSEQKFSRFADKETENIISRFKLDLTFPPQLEEKLGGPTYCQKYSLKAFHSHPFDESKIIARLCSLPMKLGKCFQIRWHLSQLFLYLSLTGSIL